MEEESDKSVFTKQQNISGDAEETFTGDDLSDPTNKSRRPPNAYILYCLEKRTELRNIHPELPNIEISRMLGQNWKSLEEVARRPYKEKAKLLQTEFKKEHPDYKYEKARKKRITQEILMANNKTSSNSNNLNNLNNLNLNLNYFSNTLSSLLSANGGLDGAQGSTGIDLAQISRLMKCFQEIKQKQQVQLNQTYQNQNQNSYQTNNTLQQDFQQQNELNELMTEPNAQNDNIIGDNSNLGLLQLPAFPLNASPISANPGSSLGLSLTGADAPSFASDFSYLSTDFQTQFD
ncbi:Transcription factor SOX-17 [Tritrichomonas musculus]|uniref:Transcription factor SOX-17 n=1 Tax=Tritrichomonas musculus TaxID=1915356 RepID=A0ABR2KWU0_9EUKA